MRTNFFDLPKPELPRKTITLPSFGEVVLEKMDTASQMRLQSLTEQKYKQWGAESDFPFMVDDRWIDVTYPYAATCCALVVMQKQPQPYNFEELIHASVKAEDEYNLLVLAARDLNDTIDESGDPKAFDQPEKESSDLKVSA